MTPADRSNDPGRLKRQPVMIDVMRVQLGPLALAVGVSLSAVSAASADALDSAAVHAVPQYYLLALPTGPVSEIAGAVLGEALGLPFQIDEDVDAELSFRAEGLFAPKALATEFGDRLMDVQVALVDRPSDGLWLIPMSELGAYRSEGALMVTSIEPAASMAKRPNPPVAGKRTVGTGHSPDQNWPGWLAIAAVSAAGGWSGWLALAGSGRRQRTQPPALSFAPDHPADDLLVPHFEQIETRSRIQL